MSHHYSGPDFSFPQGDARLDFTDLYAFPKPGGAGKSILIMNVHPSAGENPPGATTMQKITWENSSASMVAEHGAKAMNMDSKDKLSGVDSPRPATAEQRRRVLG